jgi:transposase
MSFVRRFKRNGRIYLGEVENKWEDGKVRQKFIRYIGLDPEQNKNIFPQNLSDLSIDGVKVYGSVIILDFIARELRLHDLLGEYSDVILPLVYCHCHDYKSLSDVKNWFKKTDLNKVFKIENLTEKRLHRGLLEIENMDKLVLQKSIFETLQEKYKLKISSAIYDVTNIYFTGKACNLANKGKSKDGVKGRRIVQIGLGVLKDTGFPLFHQVHKGNVHDSKIFYEGIEYLKNFKIYRGTIIYDRGLTSKNNILELNNDNWKLIGGMPLHKGIKNFISEMDFSKLEKYTNRVELGGSTVFYVTTKDYTYGGVSGKLIILLNPQKKQDIREIRLKKIIESKQLLRQKKEVLLGFEKFFTKDGKINSHALKRKEKYDGLSILFTTGKYSKEEIVRLYFEKDIIEKSFQVLKLSLALRPVRHWLGGKAEAHIFICYLSYLLLTTFKFLLKNSNLDVKSLSVQKALSEMESVYRGMYYN